MSELNTEPQYTIPLRYRIMENLHIVFWLCKDLAWCMGWHTTGVVMVIPTFIIAVVVSYRTRHIVSELCHNMAVAIWIGANSYWMVSEFWHFDEKPLFGQYTYKHLAVVPFTSGILILLWFYLWWKPRNAVQTAPLRQ